MAQGEVEAQTKPWFLRDDFVLTRAIFEVPQDTFCDCFWSDTAPILFIFYLLQDCKIGRREEKQFYIKNQFGPRVSNEAFQHLLNDSFDSEEVNMKSQYFSPCTVLPPRLQHGTNLEKSRFLQNLFFQGMLLSA